MSLLKKWCKKDHLIPGCSTLRVGSHIDYRWTSQKSISDIEEGGFTLKFENKAPFYVSKEDFCRLFPGYFFDGPSYFTWDSRGFGSSDGLSVIVQDGKVTVHAGGNHTWMFPNCFVFSMTYESSSRASPFHEYDSEWSINSDHTDEMAEELRVQVERCIRPFEVITSDCLNLVRGEKTLSVDVMHGPVLYGLREIKFSGDRDYDLHRFEDEYWKMPFVKPLGYEAEKEYRFVIAITWNGMPLSIYDRSILIPSEPFLKFLS